MKPSELVNAARDEIFMGWTQGAYRQGNNVCSVAALERAAMKHLAEGAVDVFGEAREAVSMKALEMFGESSIPTANDRGDTTKEDVLAMFDKAAIGLEEVGS